MLLHPSTYPQPDMYLEYCIVFLHIGGVILEEAEQRVGGRERLLQALQAGRCIRGTHNNMDVYFFPQVKVGKMEEITATAEVHKTKDTTEHAADDIMGALDEMEWAIAGSAEGTGVPLWYSSCFSLSPQATYPALHACTFSP